MKHLSNKQGYEDCFERSEEGYLVATDDFMEKLQDDDFQDIIKHKFLTYLLIEDDPVENFHLGNGAEIGDLKFNLKDNRDWVMVNYVYPESPELLENNAQIYRSGKRLLASHLHNILNQSEHEMLDSRIAQPVFLPQDEPE